jgi:16S rRNA (cytosine967-C5)-methyltransferase
VVSSRAVAIRALARIEGGAFANVALPATLRGADLAPRDRAQVTDWVYGAERWQRTLDHFLAPHVERSVERLDPPVRAALRLGVYQLWSGVPAHAAVGETVAAVGAVAPRAKGFVNAVLRAVAAVPLPWPLPEGDDIAAIGVRASLPDWIVARLLADLGREDALATIETLNEPPAVTLRVNPRRATPDAVETELVAAGAHVGRGALLDGALLVTGAGDLGGLAAVRDGRVTPQDQASQAVVSIVGAQPGERVLEIGAAPGGKSTGLAEAMDDRGLVVALDAHAGRTRLVGDAARRLGLGSVAPVVADGRAPALRAAAFDRVLLDAPCSGLGVLRRRPEARWRLRPEQIDELAELQRVLLARAATLVRPGGRLVYSVCTLSGPETVEVDEWARVHLVGLDAVVPPGPPWQPVGRGARLLPHAAGTDGMYCLILQAPG